MALEPAGVTLVAENFNKYIKQLESIDRRQQDIFDVDSKKLDKAYNDAIKSARDYEKSLGKAASETKGLGTISVSAGNLAAGAIDKLIGSIVSLGQTAATSFIEITKGGVALNQQAELTEKVFSNVFGDPKLGKATLDFLNETSDRLRIARDDAASFAQIVLPRTDNLEQFTELLRLTDIQADSTGQAFEDLKFAIAEAISGDFSRLKERFDFGTAQIDRIKQLTPELGAAGALVKVINEEFTKLGKTDISGTLSTNIKDLNTRFSNLQTTLGKPTFDQLRIQSENLLGALDRNQEGLQRTAISLGQVTANVVELIGTELVDFIDSLDFRSIETGIRNLNAFVEALRVVAKTIRIAFETGVIQTAFGIINKDAKTLITGLTKLKDADFGQAFTDIKAAVDNAITSQQGFTERVDEAANAESSLTNETKDQINQFLASSAATNQAAQAIQGYTNTLKQAEQLQLSFSRAAEDTAIKLARANEDIARKQAQSVAKLQQDQAKDREKLLKSQAKELDKFEADRRKQIAKAEGDIKKARQEANEQRKRDQQKLQRELAQAQERFNLSQLQSERRFKLQESRLIAEGDILGLKQLREDQELARQEEKENFDLSQKEQVKSAQETQKEQAQDLENKLKELKTNLEEQRAELLRSFDEQLAAQVESQAEARAEQQRGFEEAAAERAIQLAREEEDRRLSQARQLEDLGRSLAEQQGVTAEGSQAVAGELEKVFGIDGAADSVMKGFTERTENDFTDLFKNLEKTVSAAKINPPKEPVKIPVEPVIPLSAGGGGAGGRIGGIPEFQEGGVVPGSPGSPQLIMAHGGETVLPTQRSYQMAAPIIPSQALNVNMSGGFNISGDGQADERILKAATAEMTENFRIAIERLARRN